MPRLLFLCVAVLMLQGCDAGGGLVEAPPAAPEPVAAPVLEPVQGFAHQAGADLFGYYLPASDVRIGDLELSHFYIGDGERFEAWESAPGAGVANFAPVMFQFDDLSSETIANDLGGQTPSVVVRVLPTAYGVSESVVRFAGVDPTLGPVTFEGVFLRPALVRVQNGGASDELVLRGTLTIGDQIYEGQAFTWHGGD